MVRGGRYFLLLFLRNQRSVVGHVPSQLFSGTHLDFGELIKRKHVQEMWLSFLFTVGNIFVRNWIPPNVVLDKKMNNK